METLEVLRLTTLVEEKKKVGYFLPQPMIDAFEVAAARMPSKREKWIVVSAALLNYLELPEHKQNELIRRVKAADTPGGSFLDLLERVLKKSAPEPKKRSRKGTSGSVHHGGKQMRDVTIDG